MLSDDEAKLAADALLLRAGERRSELWFAPTLDSTAPPRPC
jgi:hypothetical protein